MNFRNPIRFLAWLRVNLLATVLGLLLTWIIVMSLMSLFADGIFYHVVPQPVLVVDVSDSVTLHYRRFSRLDMHGLMSRELQCDDQVYNLPDRTVLLEKGWSEFDVVYSVPDGAVGKCSYRVLVTYQPFGVFGPTLKHGWDSEVFTLGGL